MPKQRFNFLASSILFTSIAQANMIASPQENLLAVYINGQDYHQVTTFLQKAPHQLWIQRQDLQQWHLHLPHQSDIQYYDGRDYCPLSAFPAATYRIDNQKMVIDLTFAPTDFKTQDYRIARQHEPTPVKSKLSAFMNYDVFTQRTADVTATNGIFTPGIFTPDGAITSSTLLQNHASNNDNHRSVRLNTLWQTDYPQSMQTLRIGDTYSTPGAWGSSVNFGGIQWGTNFATDPNFITYPLPSTRVLAVVPSSVDLYVNNALVSNRNVTTGPFAITAIPVVTGNGNISVVTTDLLGRQRIVNVPYYASDELLKAGLQDYSVEAGFTRKNFGINSNQYQQFSLISTDNIGITNHWTLQWHSELQKSLQNAGIGENYLVRHLGIFSSALAVSHYQQHVGQLLLLGFQRQAFAGINYGVRLQAATSHFNEIGFSTDHQPMPALINQVFLGIPIKNHASFNISYLQENNRYLPHNSLISCSYNQTVFKNWSLNVSTLTTISQQHHQAIFLTLTRALGQQNTLSLGNTWQAHQNQATAQLSRSLPLGPGWGYNLYAAQGSNANYQANLLAQNDYGTYRVGAARQQNNNGYQAEAQGSVVLLADNIYLTRALSDSFAVIKIPHYSHVRVYSENQEIGRTDNAGNIFVPSLLPYQNNTIRINPADLPIATAINHTSIDAVPYEDSGLVVRFPIHHDRHALITLQQSNGDFVPAGAVITAIHAQPAMVAEDGAVYLQQLQIGENQFVAQWADQSCHFIINYQHTKDPLPNLGTVICA